MEINWQVFKAKHPNPQKSFEDLCYVLFCREHGFKFGLFGYKNQAGLEKEPIDVNGELIGFTAKFFEYQVGSTQIKDIKDSLETAKSRHPDLKKVYLYIYPEIGPSHDKTGKSRPPQKQLDIENYAKSLGIEIIWRVPSHIEYQLQHPENRYVAEDNFSLDKTTFDSIKELVEHTKNILERIRPEIDFKEKKIKLDTNLYLEELSESIEHHSIVVVSGEAGVGKSSLIKDLYLNINGQMPFFVFKPYEFNEHYINDFLRKHGNDFIESFKDEGKKAVVIDSAEKISDLNNQEPIGEFVSALVRNNWSIIFTIRYDYIEDLAFTIERLWSRPLERIDVRRLTAEELEKLSKEYEFVLPTDKKLVSLLEVPFYLNEYLTNYREIEPGKIDEEEFKKVIWKKHIQGLSKNSSTVLKREKCFKEIAVKRAKKLMPVVNDIECEEEILNELEDDGVISFDRNLTGYLVTYDIYEEWALEKYISESFNSFPNITQFLDTIGDSLPIRREFRSWLSKNIEKDINKVKPIIDAFRSDSVNKHWKDEIIVSIQFTPYSEIFYDEFREVLSSDTDLLERIIFKTRVACKEIDLEFYNSLGISNKQISKLSYLLMRPKGEGWRALIKFLYDNKERINVNVNDIIGLLNDWIIKNKKGETTRNCGLLGIYLLNEMYKSGKGFSYADHKNPIEALSKIILNSASEIKEELQNIFDEVLQNENFSRREKYDELVHLTLTSLFDFQEVVKALPEKVLELANKFWYQVPKKDDPFYSPSPFEMEESFCLNQAYELEYFPSSAFQTPAYFLLKVKPVETLKFILDFVNKTAECCANSQFKNEIKIVEVLIDGETAKQYISTRLWNMYRGTSTSPYLLQCIHMALEKWLLEIAKIEDIEKIENILKYLIRNSKSASITSAVTSVVLANPIKLRNTALILFKTKDFFFFDTKRMDEDMSARSLYSIGYGLDNDPIKKIRMDERLKTCEDKHRMTSLENLMRNLQFFKTEGDIEFEQAREKIFQILDNYYSKLPSEDKETDEDKTWKLYLARMDSRKINPVLKKDEKGIMIEFNPQLDDNLKKYSEESLKESSESLKHTSLRVWSIYRFQNDKQDYSKDEYRKYEENPNMIIEEMKETLKELEKNKAANFRLFNGTIPIYACSVLIRDFFEKLNDEEKNFCKDLLFGYLNYYLSDNYIYQVGDGLDAAISILPGMLTKYPKDTYKIREYIVKFMFSNNYQALNILLGIIPNVLWDTDYSFAQSLFLGFLFLRPKLSLMPKSRGAAGTNKLFSKQHEKELKNIIESNFNSFDIGQLKVCDEQSLINAFYLLKNGSEDSLHVAVVSELAETFSKEIFSESFDYDSIDRFLKKFATFVLFSKKENVDKYIKPFVDNFKLSNYAEKIFADFITAEDYLNQYEHFWYIWDKFYDKIINLAKESCSNHYMKVVLRNYLLAYQWWKESAREWHSLKEENKVLYRKIVVDIGYCPVVLYSISKVLYDIGSGFLDDGIYWISDIIKKHGGKISSELETNTVYYLEVFVKRYILTRREQIRTERTIKEKLLVVLDFLVEQGSSQAYFLREDIL